jgi:hypothetical protein
MQGKGRAENAVTRLSTAEPSRTQVIAGMKDQLNSCISNKDKVELLLGG